MEAFVSYAYTGEILLTDSNALNYLEISDYLVVDSIKEACVEFLKEHLKIEEACRAYKFADAVNLPELKNVARETVITNFGDCSKNAVYLDFDYESLADILSNGETLQPSEVQLIFFEGIMRWILYDADNRKIHIKNLLSCIDVTELTADDMIRWVCENFADRNDQHDIIKDTIVYYHTSKIEQKRTPQEKQGQVLIMECMSASFRVQFYNLNEKKWSSVQEIPESDVVASWNGAVLNDKLYSMYSYFGTCCLKMFDQTTKQITNVYPSNTILRSKSYKNGLNTAMCACSRFVYLCGGTKEYNLPTDEILRYDPQANSLEKLTPMGAKRCRAAAIFYQGYLHVLGGQDESSKLNSVEVYNPETKKWTGFPSMCVSRQRFSVAILDEKLYACGGDHTMRSVEFYNPETNYWLPVASMKKERCDFLLVAYKGKLLAIGGDDEKTVEVYNPIRNKWLIDLKMSSGLQMKCLLGGFISSSPITDSN